MLPAESHVIGPLPHRSGATAWLATFITPMSPEQTAYILAEKSKFRLTTSGEPRALQGATAILVQDSAQDDTMLINIELGIENVVHAG